MFISCSYIGGNDYNEGDYNCKYLVYDDDFTDEVNAASFYAALAIPYETRKLNVAANLIKAYLWEKNSCGSQYTIDRFINNCRTNNPNFHKYEQDFMKYAVLL